MNKKHIEIVFIAIMVFFGIAVIYLANGTPFLGEDEATYVNMGKQFSNQIYDTYTRTGRSTITSPFTSLFYAMFFLVLGPSLSTAKAITAFFGFLTFIIIYLIGRKVNIYVGMFSVIVLLLMTLFTHMSMLAYVDVPTAFFSALILYLAIGMDSKRKSVLLGMTMGLAYFVKVSEFYVTMIVLFYSFYLLIFKREGRQFKLMLSAFLISVVFILPYILRNIIIYNYPFFIILDMLLPMTTFATGWIGPGPSVTSPVLNFHYFTYTFGFIPIAFAIFGSLYLYFDRGKNPKEIVLATVMFLIFLAMFFALYILGEAIAEPRYFLIMFPQMALIGGYWLGKLKDYSKYTWILIIPVIVFAFYSSMNMMLSTSTMERFPSNYIEALEWVGKNTPEDALIFTTYSGTVRNYANRDDIWTEITVFDKLMTTDNATYASDVLKEYNVSYILIWRGVVSESYIIPGANLAGVFSRQFVNTVMNAPNLFSIEYQNADNLVMRVK